MYPFLKHLVKYQQCFYRKTGHKSHIRGTFEFKSVINLKLSRAPAIAKQFPR